MKPVRSSVKAVIIRDDCLLAIENRDDRGPWYMLPGGGQNSGETLHEALLRECHEEIGSTVEIGPLLFVRDYIGKHHEFAATSSDFHQIELMFACSIPSDYSPSAGHLPDNMQTGVRWIKLSDLQQTRFYPKALVSHLLAIGSSVTPPVYLGDVN